MFNKNNKKKGLTLIETVISLAILMIVLGPMLGIINLSVKTNKDGERTQNGLYAVQKYAEQYKREDIDSTKFKDESGNPLPQIEKKFDSDTDIPKGYFIHVKMEPLNQYNFADTDTSADTSSSTTTITPSPGYSGIDYDVKLAINTNSSNNPFVSVTGKDKSSYQQLLQDGYTIDISNGDARNSTLEEETILVAVKDSLDTVVAGPWEISKIRSGNASIKDGNIIVQVDANKDKSSGSLNINCYNKVKDGCMNVYSAQLKDASASSSNDKSVMNCSINNCEGTVKVYSNITALKDIDENHKNGTRLYKITVSLYKNGDSTQDPNVKPVQRVIAYKTVHQ